MIMNVTVKSKEYAKGKALEAISPRAHRTRSRVRFCSRLFFCLMNYY